MRVLNEAERAQRKRAASLGVKLQQRSGGVIELTQLRPRYVDLCWSWSEVEQALDKFRDQELQREWLEHLAMGRLQQDYRDNTSESGLAVLALVERLREEWSEIELDGEGEAA